VKGDQGTGDLGHTFGSGFPLATWLDYMRVAMHGQERQSFDPPTHRTSTQTPTAKPTPTMTPTLTPTPSVTGTPTATAPPTTAPPTTAPPTTAPPTDTGTPKAP